MRAARCLALLALLALTVPAVHAQAAPDRAAEEGAIRHLLEHDVARLFSGTTAAEAEAMAALWSEQSTHGGVLGTPPTRTGRTAVQHMWTAGMTRRPKDYPVRARVTVAAIQWVRPDVAAVDALVTYTGALRPDGTPEPDSKEALFAIVTRETAGWRITASRMGKLPAARAGGSQ